MREGVCHGGGGLWGGALRSALPHRGQLARYTGPSALFWGELSPFSDSHSHSPNTSQDSGLEEHFGPAWPPPPA